MHRSRLPLPVVVGRWHSAGAELYRASAGYMRLRYGLFGDLTNNEGPFLSEIPSIAKKMTVLVVLCRREIKARTSNLGKLQVHRVFSRSSHRASYENRHFLRVWPHLDRWHTKLHRSGAEGAHGVSCGVSVSALAFPAVRLGCVRRLFGRCGSHGSLRCCKTGTSCRRRKGVCGRGRDAGGFLARASKGRRRARMSPQRLLDRLQLPRVRLSHLPLHPSRMDD